MVVKLAAIYEIRVCKDICLSFLSGCKDSYEMRKNESRYRKLNLEDSAVFSLNSVLIVLVLAELKPLT
jgi:hypothetical protein